MIIFDISLLMFTFYFRLFFFPYLNFSDIQNVIFPFSLIHTSLKVAKLNTSALSSILVIGYDHLLLNIIKAEIY